jgi:protein-S-isoprenylcysteine O-methyltransferase Ste14
MSENQSPGPAVRFPPPFLFVGGLAIAALLHSLWALPILAQPRQEGMLVLAYVFLFAGLAWMSWGLITFLRARTAIIPHHPATRLVTSGPYRFGRNPMYLGLSAVYLGITLWLNTVWAILLFPAVIAGLIEFVIRREERYLNETFGEDYERYRRRVSRWFTLRATDSRERPPL